jgi:hypothetical protein
VAVVYCSIIACDSVNDKRPSLTLLGWEWPFLFGLKSIRKEVKCREQIFLAQITQTLGTGRANDRASYRPNFAALLSTGQGNPDANGFCSWRQIETLSPLKNDEFAEIRLQVG